jgi:hypothetical protein
MVKLTLRKGILLAMLVSLFSTILISSTIKPVQALDVTSVFYSRYADGWVQNSSTVSYGLARNASTGTVYDSLQYLKVGQRLTGSTYQVFRVFFHFNTSTIPSYAQITAVNLSIYIGGDFSDTDFNITVQNGQPSYPNRPLQTGDYNKGHYSGNGGQRNTSDMVLEGGYYNITFFNSSLSWINTQGDTKLCLRSSRDINNIEPSGNEWMEPEARDYVGESRDPKIFVHWTPQTYMFYGAYNEDTGLLEPNATRAVNVTAYLTEETAFTFELNGTYEYAPSSQPSVFKYNLGYNTSRVYYVKDNFETIYVFRPTAPYNTYTFNIIDYVGITNGYLETLLNINGTNRVIERWSLGIVNSVPFILSWAKAYQLRLICDQGTHSWGHFVALEDTSQTLVITPGMFPITYPGLVISVNASRMNATWIQANYSDSESLTSWVQITIRYKQGYGWSAAYTQNNTGNTHQLNWYDADEDVDYLARVTAFRDDETLTWSFNLPKPPSTTNPWSGVFDSLGTFPIPARNIVGLCIVLGVFAVFSYIYLPLGCVLGVLIASFLTIIAWLDINWNFIALAFAVAIFVGISRAKRVEREI